MPDLSEQLSAILQNPEAQRNIQNMLASLQQNSEPSKNQNLSAPSFDFSSLFNQSQPSAEPNLSSVDMSMLMKLQGIFSKMNCEDSNVNLLRALRPHLKNPQKVDGAINILRLMSVLPALEECGIFGGGNN
jgi:hypothetical protein